MLMTVKAGLAAYAANRGYSLASLARKAGITRVHLTRLAGGRKTTPETARKIANALETEIEQLFEPEGGKS